MMQRIPFLRRWLGSRALLWARRFGSHLYIGLSIGSNAPLRLADGLPANL
jgi:hypothetical protein